MSGKKKGRLIAAILLEVVCLILFGYVLVRIQTGLSVSNQKEMTQEKLDEMQSLIDRADASALQNEASYDEVYHSKAKSVAYIALHDASYKEDDATMKSLAEMMQTSNILILDREGKILAQAEDTQADPSRARFEQLRTVFETGEVSEPFEVTVNDVTRRYYAAKIDDEREAVIEQDPEELHQIQDDTSSWESIIGKINVGLNGFTFAVSNKDYTFLYYPEEGITGLDALDAGINVADLADQNYAWMTINGSTYYCGVVSIENRDAFVVCAVPASELTSSVRLTAAVEILLFFIVLTLLVAYAFFVRGAKKPMAASELAHISGKLYYSRTMGRKLLAFSVVGFAVLLVAIFYMQTLFALSQRSISNNRQAQEAADTLAENAEQVEEIREQYNSRYLNKCQIASYILSGNHDLWTREDLAELSQVLDAEFLLIFDEDGKELVSDSTYVNFTVSSDPEDQSYPFSKLLQGLEYYVQEAMADEISGNFHQYIGVILTNEDGEAEGFVQMAMVPDKLENALASTSLSSVLGGIRTSAGGSVFAVEKETATFSYYSDEKMVGKSVLDYGMTEKELRDGYSNYLKINHQTYYASCVETDEQYLYVVTPSDHLMASRIPVTLASGAAALISLLAMFLLLSLGSYEGELTGDGLAPADMENIPAAAAQADPGMEEAAVSDAEDEEEEESAGNGPMVDVLLADGTVKKSQSAASRWSDTGIRWKDKTPEQKLVGVLKAFMGLLAALIFAAVLMKDRVFGEESVLLYVLNGDWEKGVNVFALTACIMIICVISVTVIILGQLLRILSRAMNAKGATVCHLLRNLVKYVSLIAILYECFAMFGVDTQTLLASAGILSLVIGLGAKELVSDILAGLFIIFEGEFQVGDIVTVGDWKGTVQEIGVRTTKIMDAGENVKIISNNAISGVINMTKRNSHCTCDLTVGLTEALPLEGIEHILKSTLPDIPQRCEKMLSAPVYEGAVSFGSGTANIRVTAECLEADRVKVGRILTREVKEILDRNGVPLTSAQS